MTGEELAALPEGTIVWHDGSCGEILQPGKVCHVIWDNPPLTSVFYTESPGWESIFKDITLEEPNGDAKSDKEIS